MRHDALPRFAPKPWRPPLVAAVLGIGSITMQATAAGGPSAAGLWKTIDDKTGKPLSLVRLTEVDGELQGRVERILVAPGDDPQPRCDKCTGALKDRPIVGMTFLWGFRRDGERYGDGSILDPEEGRVYRCRIELSGDGGRLDVRGYVGIPLFGRTQIWLREP